MIYIYKVLSLILIPFIKLNIQNRIKKGKELPLRYKERFGKSDFIKKTNKKIIWIHAASVGEFKSANFFIETFHQKYTLLITTTTVSAANYAEKNYGDKIIHQFAPLDITVWIKKFLFYWKPTLIIWIESDLWPITLDIIRKQKIKAILVNVRMSPKSFKRWKKIPLFYSQLLNSFSEIYAQSKNDQERIQLLTKRNIKFIGNLKFSNINNNSKKITCINLNKNNNIITLMISSTHANEEEMLMPIIKDLLKKFNHLQIIIAPRHPERSKELIALCDSFKLIANLESEKNKNNSIIIINSFGILSNYFILSDIVFLGGSLIPAGGHNPIEPAIHNCAILTGPQIFNWQNIFDDMINNKACLKIQSIQELKTQLNNLINDKKKTETMKTNAYNFAQNQFVDTNILKKIINNYMNF